MDKKDHIKKFVEKALDWELWVEKANELIEVASFIKPHINEKAWDENRERTLFKEHYITIYFMLMSYALENLLKALKIKNDSQLKGELKQTKKFPKGFPTHDVYSLAKDAGLMSENDYPDLTEALLTRMSKCAKWFGRYPVPVEANDIKSFFELENADYSAFARHYSSTDVSEIDKIIESAYSKLGKQPPKK